MPDPLTTPRKLDQIRWENGITDGDIRNGFFLELLNVESDEGGRIRCRDGVLVESVEIPSSDPMRYVHLNGDPSQGHSGGWNVFISETTVYIYPWQSTMDDADAATLAMPSVAELGSIEVLLLGSSVYLASVNRDTGDPNPVISVTWSEFKGRFTSPEYVLDGDDTFGELAASGVWVINSLERKPSVKIFTPTTKESSLGPFNHQRRRATAPEISSYLAGDPENRVALYTEYQRKDTVDNDILGYTESAEIELAVVFVYADGALSVQSEFIRHRVTLDTDETFDIGISLMVDSALFQGISQVRVYRRVLQGGTPPMIDHELLIVSPLYDNEVHENTSVTAKPAPYGNRDLTLPPTDSAIATGENLADYYKTPEEEAYGVENFSQVGWNQDYYGIYSGTVGTRIGYNHLFNNAGVDDTMKETAGWLKIPAFPNVMMFMPLHYYNQGEVKHTCTYHQESVIRHAFGITFDDSIRVMDRYNINIDNSIELRKNDFKKLFAMVVGSACPPNHHVTWDAKLGTSRGVKGPNTTETGLPTVAVDHDLVGYRGYFRLGDPTDTHLETTDGGVSNIVTTIGAKRDVFEEGFYQSFVMNRDAGQTGLGTPSLESEFGGASVEHISEVQPRHIGSAGGRLFGLNLKEDGVERPSKLMYTEFGKFSTFRSDNFISYGVRDDGQGVAITTLKSFVIAHHSSSTYVFDISGGSDLVWREVGAYFDVGALHNDLIAVTPFGVFWCDKSHLWSYGGQTPQPITNEIKKTYREIVSTAYALLYKEDLRQLWLLSTDNDAFIYNLEDGSWHTHRFVEGNLAGKKIRNLFTSGNEVFLSGVSPTDEDFEFYKLSRESTSSFPWTIDTGLRNMDVPEVVKKIRRLYINIKRDAPFNDVNRRMILTSTGDDGVDIVEDNENVNDKVIRISASVRGYHVRFKIEIKEESFWRGYLDSLGVSYKLKNLK